MDQDDHWRAVYAERPPAELSWFQREPAVSLRLISAVGSPRDLGVLDVGAGTSLLVDALLERGCTDVTILDVTDRPLREVKQRLGQRGDAVAFVVGDVLAWSPDRTYDVWHDRAVFHFLVDAQDRDRYVQRAGQAVRAGGHVVIATFAPTGPTQCSGLPTCRYDAEELADRFSESFEPVAHEHEEHVTPTGVIQPFTWLVLRRVGA